MEIDLTQLPAPAAVEEFNFEQIFERKKTALIALCPEHIRQAVAATLQLESEPLTIDLQQQAYAEMLLRQRINEATRAGFLALAEGADLEHIGASRGLARKIIQAADPLASPPVPEILESDADFRRRIQMHPEKFAAAGPRGAYIAHALDIDDVADANPTRPQPGTVRVYIKSYSGGGIPTQTLIDTVQQHLSAESRRPLCDSVEVVAATAKEITINYTSEYEAGPDKKPVAEKQRADLQDLLDSHGKLEASLALSKIIGALDGVGVRKVTLHSPAEDIVCEPGEFIRVVGIKDRSSP